MLPQELQLLQTIPFKIVDNLDYVWTFVLLLTRCTTCITFFPGIGMGIAGLPVRLPALIVMSWSFVLVSPLAPVPADWYVIVASIVSEIALGLILGIVPLLIVVSIQTGAQLASTSMGLSAGSLFDPNLGVSSTDFARLLGETMIAIFLVIGGHHMVLYGLAGFGGEIAPGSFLVTERSVDMLMIRSAHVFQAGLLISAPIVVALLLTQFVMGLVSKMVPTLNIFIVSFPLTVAIGLTIALISVSSIAKYVVGEFNTIESAYSYIFTE